jgi:hypothetical protein
MQLPDLNKRYTREEAIACLNLDGGEEYSKGHLLLKGRTGSLFEQVGHPPYDSYFITGKRFCWISTESNIQFYNSTVLSFQSRFRSGGRELHFFGKLPDEIEFTCLGLLSVENGDGPSSSYSSPWFPKTVIVRFAVEPRLGDTVFAKFDWSNIPIAINTLPLPSVIRKAITSDRWKFATPDQMARNTDALRHLAYDGLAEYYSIGSSSKLGREITDPHILDIDQAICLGDTGPEEPLCLDYRTSATNPRVVHLLDEVRWRPVAPDIETFVNRMEMRVS